MTSSPLADLNCVFCRASSGDVPKAASSQPDTERRSRAEEWLSQALRFPQPTAVVDRLGTILAARDLPRIRSMFERLPRLAGCRVAGCCPCSGVWDALGLERWESFQPGLVARTEDGLFVVALPSPRHDDLLALIVIPEAECGDLGLIDPAWLEILNRIRSNPASQASASPA